jgi:hypothetical protein
MPWFLYRASSADHRLPRETADAVGFLRNEVKTYAGTSIQERIQKNINVLSLEGKPAPATRNRGLVRSAAAVSGQPAWKGSVVVFLGALVPEL